MRPAGPDLQTTVPRMTRKTRIHCPSLTLRTQQERLSRDIGGSFWARPRNRTWSQIQLTKQTLSEAWLKIKSKLLRGTTLPLPRFLAVLETRPRWLRRFSGKSLANRSFKDTTERAKNRSKPSWAPVRGKSPASLSSRLADWKQYVIDLLQQMTSFFGSN